MNPNTVAETLSPDIVNRFRKAIETGKWPNGDRLSLEQKETCMQAVIAWEKKHLPEYERTGYVPPKSSPCADNTADTNINTHPSDEQPLRWKK